MRGEIKDVFPGPRNNWMAYPPLLAAMESFYFLSKFICEKDSIAAKRLQDMPSTFTRLFPLAVYLVLPLANGTRQQCRVKQEKPSQW